MMEQRLIDANRLQLEVDKFFRDEWRVLHDLTSIISMMPTVDAVEVVRCKDCKHYRHGKHFTDINFCQRLPYYAEKGGLNTADDDFCSYGERRDSDG